MPRYRFSKFFAHLVPPADIQSGDENFPDYFFVHVSEQSLRWRVQGWSTTVPVHTLEEALEIIKQLEKQDW